MARWISVWPTSNVQLLWLSRFTSAGVSARLGSPPQSRYVSTAPMLFSAMPMHAFSQSQSGCRRSRRRFRSCWYISALFTLSTCETNC
uniref:Putative secreted protein n=1 Tax=Anopheles marajoara TaxID=58244 RepID=A0A2M4CBD3_9DIPT